MAFFFPQVSLWLVSNFGVYIHWWWCSTSGYTKPPTHRQSNFFFNNNILGTLKIDVAVALFCLEMMLHTLKKSYFSLLAEKGLQTRPCSHIHIYWMTELTLAGSFREEYRKKVFELAQPLYQCLFRTFYGVNLSGSTTSTTSHWMRHKRGAKLFN